ncbi:hypothetical protein FLL45_21975 [Aliikangiella marina]|uniref:Uncharacterized protein n=1 Tax=Aliikangiella marina TaxID=1712262 RepID=A0A545T199_9GAMM|nr:hypothetical protein [Aliikangiella marina]TQV70998.1 hypothetical protein FLL45_21975 [Aliikangiella marina]
MIPDSCIKIKTNKFPILAGEEEALVNENMYGKALCLYLQENLPTKGIEVPFYCCEDWGWWLEVKDKDFAMGLCVYSDPDADGNPTSYAIMPSIHNAKKWSWSKFRKIDVSENVLSIMDKASNILEDDSEIDEVTRHRDFPY